MGNYACRQCWMSKHDGAEFPFASGQPRTAAHNAAHRQAAVETNISKTARAAAMAEVSIKDVDNGFADIWFGANGMGELSITRLATSSTSDQCRLPLLHMRSYPGNINSASLPDLLHQFELGVMKRAFLNVLIAKASQEKPAMLTPANKKIIFAQARATEQQRKAEVVALRKAGKLKKQPTLSKEMKQRQQVR